MDKTYFIKEWWENQDEVTLITRPRRFGKTLTMSMVEQFFSVKYAGKGGWFENLSIWQEEDWEFFWRVRADMDDADAVVAVWQLSKYLYSYYGKRVMNHLTALKH